MQQGLRLIGLRRVRRLGHDEQGQSTVEYATVTAAILGGMAMGAPFLVQTLNALDMYFRSVYFVIESAIP